MLKFVQHFCSRCSSLGSAAAGRILKPERGQRANTQLIIIGDNRPGCVRFICRTLWPASRGLSRANICTELVGQRLNEHQQAVGIVRSPCYGMITTVKTDWSHVVIIETKSSSTFLTVRVLLHSSTIYTVLSISMSSAGRLWPVSLHKLNFRVFSEYTSLCSVTISLWFMIRCLLALFSTE